MSNINSIPRLLLYSFICFVVSANVFSQTLQTNLWETDGTVYCSAFAPNSNRLYIGGDFHYVGPHNVEGGVLIDRTSGNAILGFPKVHGTVFASVPDGAGGWFIGGDFDKVGDEPIYGLAHINADYSIDLAWDGRCRTVYTMALSGSTLYIGGTFLNIRSGFRNGIGALDVATGNVTSWNAQSNGAVNVMAISGSTMYVGGTFTSIGGQSRNNLAALDLSTAVATGWNPNANSAVEAILVTDSKAYIGGLFTAIGGVNRNYLAELDLVNGNVTTWNPDCNDLIYSIVATGTTLYAGGGFTTVGATQRNHVAAFDLSTGNLTAWNPNANDWVYKLAVSGSTVYAVGGFTQIGGTQQLRIATLDATSGNINGWYNGQQSVNDGAVSVTVSGGFLYIGGVFTSIGGKLRRYLAEIDATTGEATDWNPNPNNTVYSLFATSNNVYAGGDFTQVGPWNISRIAEIDRSTGTVSTWNTSVNNTVRAIEVVYPRVYIGGDFTAINGETRNYIGAIDAMAGNLMTFNPDGVGANAKVNTLVIANNTLYAGGDFITMGNSISAGVAAFDLSTDNLLTWHPNVGISPNVKSIVVFGPNVYLGGWFTESGTLQRYNMILADISTADVSSWSHSGDWAVNSLALSGRMLYACGNFSVIAGGNRNGVAVLDAITGGLQNDIGTGTLAYTVSVSPLDRKVYFGAGGKLKVNTELRTHLIGVENPADSLSLIYATASSDGELNLSGMITELNGVNQMFIFTPLSGAHVEKVIVDGVDQGSMLNYTFTNIQKNHTLRVEFARETHMYSVNAKWNLISVPVVPGNFSKSFLYATSISNAFSYNNGYANASTLANKKGYWLKFADAEVITMRGFTISDDTFHLNAGWNIIGSITSPVAVENIVADVPDVIASDFYGYDNGYSKKTTIEPGSGYWVRANQACNIILSSSSAQPAGYKLSIVQTKEVPPAPPGEQISMNDTQTPEEFSLAQNYPNPFNPVTMINYQLPEESRVSIKIYNVYGQEVALLVDEQQQAGYKQIRFDASALSSGVYVYKIEATCLANNVQVFTDIKKMAFIK